MTTPATARGSWSLIVTALAELGAREIERRQQAAREQAQHDAEPRRDDRPADQQPGGDGDDAPTIAGVCGLKAGDLTLKAKGTKHDRQ